MSGQYDRKAPPISREQLALAVAAFAKRLGLTEAELRTAFQGAGLAQAAPQQRQAEGWRADLDACLTQPDALTQWDLDFLASLQGIRYTPTPKQLEVLCKISAKTRRGGGNSRAGGRR